MLQSRLYIIVSSKVNFLLLLVITKLISGLLSINYIISFCLYVVVRDINLTPVAKYERRFVIIAELDHLLYFTWEIVEFATTWPVF